MFLAKPSIKESPLGPDHMQKAPFAASNPILTHYQLQKIKVRQKQQIRPQEKDWNPLASKPGLARPTPESGETHTGVLRDPRWVLPNPSRKQPAWASSSERHHGSSASSSSLFHNFLSSIGDPAAQHRKRLKRLENSTVTHDTYQKTHKTQLKKPISNAQNPFLLPQKLFLMSQKSFFLFKSKT